MIRESVRAVAQEPMEAEVSELPAWRMGVPSRVPGALGGVTAGAAASSYVCRCQLFNQERSEHGTGARRRRDRTSNWNGRVIK